MRGLRLLMPNMPGRHVVKGRRDKAASERIGAVTLTVALLGFFVITFDAVVVNVALPTIADDLGGGITGMQWVVNGYALMFAALLLTAGSFSDRVGARRAFGLGLQVFMLASVACAAAPNLTVLVVARFVQGSAAAVMLPSSMALIGHAYPDAGKRARAVGVWAMGGAIASCSAPVLGGLLTLASWRLIFLLNVPLGAIGLLALRAAAPSPRRRASIDWIGQLAAVVAMGGLTYGAIEAGEAGLAAPHVLVPLGFAALAIVVFLLRQAHARHPMVPLPLVRHKVVSTSLVVGFAFMVGHYGLPFVFSVYLQQERGLSALAAGATFLPMMVVGTALTPFSARIVERTGCRLPVVTGLASMAIGLLLIGGLPASTPIPVLSGLMVLVGICGPLVMPPINVALLEEVPSHLVATVSGLFNTSRQVGGVLAIAVFGGLMASDDSLVDGVRVSLTIAAGVATVAALAAMRLRVGQVSADTP